ncbi:MAG: 30S ribosomal protein S16 [bacterium]
MSVKIRLRRTGANNDIAFRVVATDSRSPRDGRILELLGWYDPKKKGRNFEIKVDRIEYWAGKGAVVSETVQSLMKRNKAPQKIQA